MILNPHYQPGRLKGKPRASGDDPRGRVIGAFTIL